MNSLLIFGIFVVFCMPLVLTDNLSKIKLIKGRVLIASEEYFDGFTVEVIKVNETYNRLASDYTLIKDVPLNTQFKAEVFRTKKTSTCRHYKKIGEYTISLCTNENDEYAEYLPDQLRQLKEVGKCPTKGHYPSDDTGYFKFYNLLSEQQLKNACFKLTVTFSTGNVAFLKDQFEFISNNN